MDELAEQMTEAAASAAEEALDAGARAVSAFTVSAGVRIARPIAELARDIGEDLGDLLRGIGGRFDDDADAAATDTSENHPTRRKPV